MTEPMDTPIIDPHHHFWDQVAHYYPWLCDAERPPHRYGDHGAICRPYLPSDYRRDTAAFELAGSVYVEAEWDPKDPIGEMRYIEILRKQSGLPSVAVGQAWLDQPEVDRILEQLAAFGFVRGIRHKPRANASPGDTQTGGICTRPRFWLAIFPELPSSSTTPACLRTAAPKDWRAGGRRCGAWRNAPTSS